MLALGMEKILRKEGSMTRYRGLKEGKKLRITYMILFYMIHCKTGRKKSSLLGRQ